MNIQEELKRRKVFRVAAAWFAVSWLDGGEVIMVHNWFGDLP